MGAKSKTVGGSSNGRGLSKELEGFLSQALNSGGIGPGTAAGSDAFNSTGGISGILNDLLSSGAGKVGGSYAELISKQNERDVNGLRARFGGGAGYGSPGAFAEGLLRSENASRLPTTIAGLQMQAINPILQMLSQVYGINTPQAQVIQQKNPLASIAGAAAPIIGTAIAPGLGTAIGAGVGNAAQSGGAPAGTGTSYYGGTSLPRFSADDIYRNINPGINVGSTVGAYQ